MELSRHPLIEKLLSLHLPPTDYVVVGSGPLLAHGLRDELGDLDIVARGAAWKIALDMAEAVQAPSGHGSLVLLFEGDIEVFDRWLPGTRDTNALIEGAEYIQGIPFCQLPDVLAWKQMSDRVKDRVDAKLIQRYLEKKRDSAEGWTRGR